MTSTLNTSADLQADWDRWHAERETELAVPHGWLSLVDLRWLTAEPITTTAVPGRFSLTAEGAAQVEVAAADGVTLGDSGTVVDGSAVADAPEGGGSIWLRHGTVAVELIRRTERLAIRVRDSAAPARTGFTGVPSYEVQRKWVLPATFRREPPHQIVVGAAAPDLEHVQTVVGTVDVEIDGVAQRLRAVGSPGGMAQLVFHDPTNGVETALWRSLSFTPGDDGPVTLDFNRTVNLPFAFSRFGTCPRPAAGNVITRPVTAGEQTPR